MSTRTFTVAGTSVKNGETKWRFANGTAGARIRVLEKDGHTNICLIDLPSAMTADDAKAWFQSQNSGAVAPTTSAKPARTQSLNGADRAKELHQLSWRHETPWDQLERDAQELFRRYAEEDAAA